MAQAEILLDEKEKLAKFAHQRRTENQKPFLLYTNKELEVFPHETKSYPDLFRWDELTSIQNARL